MSWKQMNPLSGIGLPNPASYVLITGRYTNDVQLQQADFADR